MIITLNFFTGSYKFENSAEYDWLPTESAPKKYPVYLIRGDLFLADSSSLYIPDRIDVANGWGEWGSTHIKVVIRETIN